MGGTLKARDAQAVVASWVLRTGNKVGTTILLLEALTREPR